MEIPLSVLENLKCNNCENYLSRSPVYLEHSGAASCGCCFSTKRPAIRNTLYETAAKLLLFPCKNRDLGCLENVPFADESENISHEEVCLYRQYVCPILGSARCDWVGTRMELLKHSEEKHPDRVKESPVSFSYDIATSSDQNYLLQAFQILFLLHTKVCVTAGKIYHAIRYLGRSDDVKNFTFTIDIKKNDVQISRKGCVTSQGCLAIQEDTSLVVNINSLLDVLGGYDGTVFTITLERLASAIENCVKCGALVTSLIYNDGGWWCSLCAPPKRSCDYKPYGCTYQDILVKNDKHQWYFCENENYCNLCQNSIIRGTILEHYESTHQNKIYRAGCMWQTRWTGSDKNKPERLLLMCVAGTAVCKYWLNDKEFLLKLFIPVSSDSLSEFECLVRVLQIATGTVRTFKPDTVYTMSHDWIVRVTKADFPIWSYEFDVSIDITKIEP